MFFINATYTREICLLSIEKAGNYQWTGHFFKFNTGRWECKSRPLANAGPCLLRNHSFDFRFQVSGGVVKIAIYTDGILIQFLFHILRFQVSGVRNDEQRQRL